MDQHDATYISRIKQFARIGRMPDPEPQPEQNPGYSDASGVDKAAKAAIAAVKTFLKLENAINAVVVASANLSTKSNAILAGYNRQQEINEQLAKSFKSVADKILFLDKINSNLQKSFGINRKAAAELSQTVENLRVKFNISRDNAQKYAGSIKELLPTYNQVGKSNDTFYQGLTAVQKVLTTNVGLSAEQAQNYTLYASQFDKNSASMIDATRQLTDSLDPKGQMGYFKQITEGIADAGAEIQLGFGKIPGNLEIAVLKSKALGLSLKDLQTVGKSFLNIESSIGEELEYQLLTGHRLIDIQSGQSLTNMMRQAVLSRNMSEQATVLNKLLEQEGDQLETNLLARESFSRLTGLSEDALAKAIQKKKLLKEAGADELFTMQGADLRSQLETMNISEAKIAEIMKNEGTENRSQTEILEEQLDVQTESKISALMLNRQMDLLLNSDKTLAAATKDLNTKFVGLLETEAEAYGTQQIATEAGKQGISNQLSLLGIKVKDAVIPPSSMGSTVISRPEGSIALDPKDGMAIVAGTKLNNAGGSTDMMQFAAAIVTAIQQQTQALKSNPTFGGGGMNNQYYS